MPNKFGSHAYRIVSEVPEEATGVYQAQDGSKLVYSPAMLGELNKETSVDYRLVKKGEKTFINLVDSGAETAGKFAAMFNQATRAGFANNSAFATAFINHTLSGNQAQVQEPAEA